MAETIKEEVCYRHGFNDGWRQAREFYIKASTLGHPTLGIYRAMRSYQLYILGPWLEEHEPKVCDSPLPECTMPGKWA